MLPQGSRPEPSQGGGDPLVQRVGRSPPNKKVGSVSPGPAIPRQSSRGDDPSRLELMQEAVGDAPANFQVSKRSSGYPPRHTNPKGYFGGDLGETDSQALTLWISYFSAACYPSGSPQVVFLPCSGDPEGTWRSMQAEQEIPREPARPGLSHWPCHGHGPCTGRRFGDVHPALVPEFQRGHSRRGLSPFLPGSQDVSGRQSGPAL